MKIVPFIKMQGAGNDFVFLSRENVKMPVTSALARRLLDRHFGVGGDQLIVYEPPKGGRPPSVAFFNADGSQAEMCGNGVRAAADYLRSRKGFRRDFVLKTKTRLAKIGVSKTGIDVDMGTPTLEGRAIPVAAAGEIVNRPLKVGSTTVRIHAVSMGNPHCVIFVPSVEKAPVLTLGPLIERHPFFPKRVNVEFVEVKSRAHVRARVWERGAGETLACGTGACAIAVAAARAGKTGREIDINLPGGRLHARWAQDNRVHLSGPAETAFAGKFFL